MITCILVGGNSQRFKDAGYGTHKAVLPLPNNITVIDEVLYNLPKEKIVISARFSQHDSLFQLQNYLARRWSNKSHIAWSHSVARGPIYGILDASEYLDVDEPVIVSYCDCWVKGGIDDLIEEWSKHESGAIGFESNDPRFGYWHPTLSRVMDYGTRISLVQKQPLPLALSGVFYFNSGKRLVKTAFEVAKPGLGIVHLLDAYTKVINVSTDFIIDVGTPEDYEAYLKSNG